MSNSDRVGDLHSHVSPSTLTKLTCELRIDLFGDYRKKKALTLLHKRADEIHLNDTK